MHYLLHTFKALFGTLFIYTYCYTRPLRINTTSHQQTNVRCPSGGTEYITISAPKVKSCS